MEDKKEGLYAFMEEVEIMNSYNYEINHYFLIGFTYGMKYKGNTIVFDKIKGWEGLGEQFNFKLPDLEKYSNIVYNKDMFEQIVKKVYDGNY